MDFSLEYNEGQKAFAEEGPSLIAVPIDYRENRLLTQRLGDIVCSI